MNKNVFKVVMPMLMALSLSGVGFSSYVFSGETGKTLQADLKVADTEDQINYVDVTNFFTMDPILAMFSFSKYGFKQSDDSYANNNGQILATCKFNGVRAGEIFGVTNNKTSFVLVATLTGENGLSNLTYTATANMSGGDYFSSTSATTASPFVAKFSFTNVDATSTQVSFSVRFNLTYSGTFSTFYDLYKSSTKKKFNVSVGAEALS